MAHDEIPVNSSVFLEVDELEDPTGAGRYVNAATVTGTVRDSAGDPVSGVTWPLVFAYVDGSNGRYQATIEPSIAWLPWATYELELHAAESSTDLERTWYRKLYIVKDAGT